MSQLLWNLICRLIVCGSRITIVDRELIPEGPKIFACNHPTSLDPCYAYHLTENAAILMTQFVFDLPLVGRLVDGCGFIPVTLAGARPRKKSYPLALNELLKGRNILIAPEGKMSSDNPGRKAHNGAARLCYVTGYPIVPIHITHKGNVVKFNIKGQRVRYMPKGETCVRVGAPFYVSDGDLGWWTQELMSTIDILGSVNLVQV